MKNNGKIRYNNIMKHKFYFLILIFLLFCAAAGFAAGEDNFESGDFWVCPVGDAALYTPYGYSYGVGFALGYGRGSSIGLKATWFLENNAISVLEINCLLRFYFFGKRAYSGPFLQFTGGPALFYSQGSEASLPAGMGIFTFGASFGWRLLLFDRVFIEPSVRAGYPYLIGSGISAGVRF
jgi:hypothetical protein